MRLGTAIERLVDNYRYASNKEWIQDKVAWALYYTWKEADDRKTENCSEIPNNCEDEPQYNFGEYADRLWKIAYERGKREALEQTEPKTCENRECKNYDTINNHCMFIEQCHYEPKDEPQTDNGIGCSRCEGRFDCYDRDMPHAVHCNNYGKITDEPQTDGILFKGNLKEGDYKLIKTSNGWVLEGNDIAYCGEPKTERSE